MVSGFFNFFIDFQLFYFLTRIIPEIRSWSETGQKYVAELNQIIYHFNSNILLQKCI